MAKSVYVNPHNINSYTFPFSTTVEQKVSSYELDNSKTRFVLLGDKQKICSALQ